MSFYTTGTTGFVRREAFILPGRLMSSRKRTVKTADRIILLLMNVSIAERGTGTVAVQTNPSRSITNIL